MNKIPGFQQRFQIYVTSLAKSFLPHELVFSHWLLHISHLWVTAEAGLPERPAMILFVKRIWFVICNLLFEMGFRSGIKILL